MPNPEVAALIANGLGAGLPHPGRPETDEPPRLIPLVAFRTAGLAADMKQHVVNTAQCVGEAIVNLVETDAGSVIIKRAELDALRAAEDQPGDSLPVVCSSCKQPMLFLRVVNGRALVRANMFTQINPACPHTMGATP